MSYDELGVPSMNKGIYFTNHNIQDSTTSFPFACQPTSAKIQVEESPF